MWGKLLYRYIRALRGTLLGALSFMRAGAYFSKLGSRQNAFLTLFVAFQQEFEVLGLMFGMGRKRL